MSDEIPVPLLASPGPVHVSQERWRAVTPLHHRTAEYRRIHGEVVSMAREALGTAGSVHLVTASGTGGMETAVANLVDRGERLLAVSGGKFGDRWGEIASALGCEVSVLRCEPGRAIDPAAVAGRVAAERPAAISLTHVESSTGVLAPLAAIARALPKPRPLVLVDAIASFGVEEIGMDAAGVDAVVAASQKAIAAPPGLAAVALSERARARLAGVRRERYYLDLRRYEAVRETTYVPFTPAVHLVQMMHFSLARMREVGWNRARERHRRSGAAFTTAMATLGMTVFPERPSAAVLVLRPPAGVEADALLAELAARHGIVMAGGQGAMKGQVVRTGFLGNFPAAVIERLAGAVADALAALGAPGDRNAALAAVGALAGQEGLYDAP